MKLQPDFYVRDDVVQIARELLGKVLCTDLDGGPTRAVITETEAYAGITDKASHAYGGRRTKRTEPMFGPGGVAYVYLCYGIHHLFNVVTNKADIPHAILVRAGVPLDNVDLMLKRRNKQELDKSLLAGPGSLSQALGITTDLTATSLASDTIWIEDQSISVHAEDIEIGTRVGVGYAENDAKLPYRFVLDADSICNQTTIKSPNEQSARSSVG